MIKDYIYALKKVYKAGRGQCIKFCVINLLLYVIQPFNLICYKKLVESIGGGGGCSSVFMLGLIVGNGVLSVIISNAIQMSKLEKKLKTDMRKKMLDTNPSDELYERVKKELNMKEKQKQYLVNKPYKRWVPILATSFCILLAIVIGVIALNNKKANAKEYNAIVQVDVNPSIQMVVDEENKVLSITGLNDEGKMIIYGEAIVGKNLDEAVKNYQQFLKYNKDTSMVKVVEDRINNLQR